MNVVASLAQPVTAISARRADRASDAPGNERGWKASLVGEQELEALGRDRVAHGNTATVAAMKLDPLDQTGVREALEATLGRGRCTPCVEAPVDLAGEHMPQRGDEGEHFKVERIQFH